MIFKGRNLPPFLFGKETGKISASLVGAHRSVWRNGN
jgi:hypothetical protein